MKKPSDWTKIRHNKLIHESGRATIEKPRHDPKRRDRYLVRIDGEWVLEPGYRCIKPFWTLKSAIKFTEKKLEA